MLESLIRTYVPIGVAAVITWLAVRFGIVLDESTSAAVAVAALGLVIAVYYTLARAIEKANPALGKVLIGLGVFGPPRYDKEPRGM